MSENLTRIIDAFQGRKILVIGDMVADVYLDGRISRISREAPVLGRRGQCREQHRDAGG